MTQMHKKGLMFAGVTAVISGLAVFANGLVVQGIDPLVHTTVKNGFVGLGVVGILLASREWQRIKTLTRTQWLQLVLIGLVGGSVPFILFFTGLKAIGGVEGAIIHKTLVLWVALLAVPLLKERFDWKLGAGIALLFGSNFVLGFKGFSSWGQFHWMVLLATVLWAIENVVAKVALKDLPVNLVVAARMGLGSLVLIAATLVSGKGMAIAALTGQQWVLLFGVGMLLFGYVMSWYRALQLAPATQVASILVAATVITTSLQALFLDKTLSVGHLVQFGAIAAGIALVWLSAREWRSGSEQLSLVS